MNLTTNIVFFGTPDFVVPVLESLNSLEGGLHPVGRRLLCVVTNPDKPTGRKQIMTPTPVKVWALKHKIPVSTPEKLDQSFEATPLGCKADLGILAAYGKILPQSVIDLFPLGILVIHPSMLPKYRGASPIQTSIMNGEKETGISIIKMDAKMDHGPIIYQSKTKSKITEEDTAGDLTKKLFLEASEVLPAVIDNWVNGKITAQEQDHSQATFTKLLTKENGYVPWGQLASAMKQGNSETINIERKIRAMSPWPGVWTEIKLNTKDSKLKTKRLKILKAHIKVLSIKSSVLCLDIIQFEGKKPQSAPSDLF